MDPKAVTWNDVTVGDRPSHKPGEVGQMVKAALTICGLDAILFSMEQLCTICGVFKLTGYRSKPKADLLRITGVEKYTNHCMMPQSHQVVNLMARLQRRQGIACFGLSISSFLMKLVQTLSNL
jgi:hypothetical protein